jgi:hypothetical protein
MYWGSDFCAFLSGIASQCPLLGRAMAIRATLVEKGAGDY